MADTAPTSTDPAATTAAGVAGDTGDSGGAVAGDHVDRWFLYLITAAAVLFSAGSIVFVMNVSTAGVRGFLCGQNDQWPTGVTWIGVTLLFLGAATAVAAAVMSGRRRAQRRMFRDYHRAIAGLGFALSLLAILNFIALAGFASQGVLDAVLGKDAAPVSINCDADVPDAVLHAKLYTLRLLLLPGFGVLGALFFVAGALRRKRDELEATKQPADGSTDAATAGPDASALKFNREKLFSGLWYRIGEAVLFALVVFLLLRAQIITIETLPETWLLVIALLLGMFVKPAELLINGIAVRLLKGVEATVGK